MGKIYSISISTEKHTLKKPVNSIQMTELGLERDGHAEAGDRQVTLMNRDDLLRVEKEHNLQLGPGDMAENIIVEGLDFSQISPGDHIALGEEGVLRVSQIGKEDHPSVVTKTFGVSILPYTGLFCKVIKPGLLQVGDRVEVIKSQNS